MHNSIVNLREEDEKHGVPEGTSSDRINSGLAEITNVLLEKYAEDKIAGLMLTGGDTMEKVCRKIGVACIKAEDNIVAQVDVGKIIGRYDGMPLVVKGGFCGSEDIGIQVAASVVVSCILAPIITSWWAKKHGCPKMPLEGQEL